jgi:hypothetical protein
MASIDKRPNGGYRARWREYPGGPQRTRHFARKAPCAFSTAFGETSLTACTWTRTAGERCSRTTPNGGRPLQRSAFGSVWRRVTVAAEVPE